VKTTLSEHLVTAALAHGLRRGELTIVGRDGAARVFSGGRPGPRATVVLREPYAARRVITGGSIGLAEGYMSGSWDTPDLSAVLSLGIANMDPEPTAPTLLTPFAKAWHRLRDNDPAGSRRNICHHYDVGNDFYRLWLDETMAYSCALHASPDESIATAHVRTWNRLLDLLQPTASDHLLEIGCGWGGFAIHAAKESGCRVTAVTLSEQQRDWASTAVRAEGLEGNVDIRLQDYRHIPEQFSAIASIEMFEAVGQRWWPTFFSRLRSLLQSGGRAALQTITIDEDRFDDYRRNPDFIQRYIFPGGMLPSPARFEAAASSAGFAVDPPHFFGHSYVRTLDQWSARFESAVPDVHALGFDDRFIRMWRYYLAYCRAGFDAGTIDVMQVRLQP